MGDWTTIVVGSAVFLTLVVTIAWATSKRRSMPKLSSFGGASRSAEIRGLGMESAIIVGQLQLPEEMLAEELSAIESAVNDGITDRKFGRHYVGLLEHFVRFIGTHRAHVIETVLYTAMYVPDENPDAKIPVHLTDEHFLIGEAFLDAFVEGRLPIPSGEDGSPDRENGDPFYTLLNYALENIEYGWMFLDILIDHEISDFRKAERFLERAKVRGFEALLSGAR
jgi:hypothetical protein